MFKSINELQQKTNSVFINKQDSLEIIDLKALRTTVIDELINTIVFSSDDQLKKRSQKIVKQLAAALNIYSQSHADLYQAFGKGELSGFTVPAINIRTLTYDFACLIFKLINKYQIGIVIFELARSEMNYTNQQPQEYLLCILAAAIKQGYQGPVFLQGDHYQINSRNFKLNQEEELAKIHELIDSSLKAGFKNLDLDASTLVDYSQMTREKQQSLNVKITAELVNYINSVPRRSGIISLGGEIGHIGGRNSTPEEFETFMAGFKAICPNGYLSKISVQTGSEHGGSILPDGKIKERTIDFSVLSQIGKIARKKYQMGGAVQHGASTLPLSSFNKFVEAQTLEIHLATGFQNIIYDFLPSGLREVIYAWLHENQKKESDPSWNEKQFIYKTRKKAFGTFKKDLWNLSHNEKIPILEQLESELITIFGNLNAFSTKMKVSPHV